MNASRERVLIRTLHLILSIPILGFFYGPVAHIPRAAWFTRFIAVPIVILSGLWLWLKPRFLRSLRQNCTPQSLVRRSSASPAKF
ncbi:MAG: hypothetical protein WBC92_07955 [Terracidiphilus sp.]